MNEQLVLLPVLLPLLGAAVGLLLAGKRPLQAAWSLVIMGFSLVASLLLLLTVWQGGKPLVFHVGGWVAPVGITLVGDLLAAFMVVMSQLVLFFGLIYALGSRDKVVTYPTFLPLFLTLTTGLTGAFLTGDLFNFFVFAELLVISGTVLTATSDDRNGTEAAAKYFYMSLLAATFLLLACGLLYASYGTLNMADLAVRIADASTPLLPVAMALLLATFMIKSAVFPMHFWQPDFHTVAPTPVSAMLSSVVVKVGVYGFVRMTTLLFVGQAAELRLLLLVLGVVGIAFGGLTAVGTHNAKRMLAYSTLAQIGFVLVGIGWGTPLSLTAALVFAFNHSLIKAAMLMLAGAVASRASVKSAAFNVVQGVGQQMPLAGGLFFVGGLALAGIPPTNGFVSKLLLFNSGVAGAQFWPLALIGVSSVLTLVYTSRAFQRIWWLPLLPGIEMKATGDRLVAPVGLLVLVVLLGVWAEPLVSLALATADWVLQPSAYVQAVLPGGG